MFKVYANAEKIKDDYFDGEIGERIFVYPSDCYGRGKTIEDALDNAFQNMGINQDWRNNLYRMNDESSVLVYCQEENCHSIQITEKDFEAWKNGEMEVFACYYYFRVKKEEDVEISELEKLELAKY